MYVSPQSQPSSIPLTDVEPAAHAASASRPRPITDGLLQQANNMLAFLLKVDVHPMDAFAILFDFLNTGSTQSYENAVREAGKTLQRSTTPSSPGSRPSAQDASTSQPRPGTRPPAWPKYSWPEKVLMCKDGGAHVKLTLGMQPPFHHVEGGVNRGQRQLPPGCLEYVSPPESTAGKRLSPNEFRKWHVTHYMDPAIQDLKPNQALLLAPPDAAGLLVGRDASGRLFGLGHGTPPVTRSHSADRLMLEADVNYALSAIRMIGAGVSNWALMRPR